MPYGAINTVVINGCVTNGSELLMVHNCTVFVTVNKEALAVLNSQAVNAQQVNGIVAVGQIRCVQVYVAEVDSVQVSVAVSAIAPEFRYLARVRSAVVSVTASKIFVTRGQGRLFITVVDGGTSHRFAFGGVKA
jgi:hypothetical protein